MAKKNKSHKKHRKPWPPQEKPMTHEEMVYDAANYLVEDVGMSFSEALGHVLGVPDPTYGWEWNLSEEELHALIEESFKDERPIDPDAIF